MCRHNFGCRDAVLFSRGTPTERDLSDSFNEQLAAALGAGYTLHRELVGGGMSRVFVATEHALQRSVVVKVLRPDLAEGINRERFRREVMLAAQLQHPLIVPVLSAGQQEQLLWYTMPFIEGESLREAIKRDGKASGREVTRILHDVLDALAYAHTRGVVHRDIKPGNILRHGNHSLVTDFGVAKALSAALPHATGMTTAGMAIGTPAYMAPEQLAGDPNADHRVDLYAVGLLAYELLTGAQAFVEESPQATMAAQLTRMPKELHVLRPDVDGQLSTLVMRLLAKNPDDRPQTANAALEELERVTTASVTVPLRAAPASNSKRMIGIAAVLVAAAAIGYYLVSRQTDSMLSASATAITDTAELRIAAARTDSLRRDSLLRDSIVRDAGRRSETAVDAPKATAIGPQRDSAQPKTATSRTRPRPAPAAASTSNAAVAARAGKRVAVFPVRMNNTRDNLAALAPQIQDSIRKAIATLGFELATDSDLLQLLSQSGTPAQRRLAETLKVGAFVTTEVTLRGDELVAQSTVLDVWRNAQGGQRQAADLDKPMDLLMITRDIGRALDRVSWRSRGDPHVVMFYEVENMTGIDSIAPIVASMNDSLRAAIARNNASVLPLDSALRATRDVTARQQVAIRRNAGLIATGIVNRLRGDSLQARLSMRDMSEDRALATIDVRFATADYRTAIAQIAELFSARLGQVNWLPKQQ